MVVDQLKKRGNASMKDHFLDNWANLKSATQIAELFDNYEDVRKVNSKPMDRWGRNDKILTYSGVKEKENRFGKTSPRLGASVPESTRERTFEKRVMQRCYHCNMPGHIKGVCPKLIKNKTTETLNNIEGNENPDFLNSYTTKGSVNGHEIDILRDTGATIDLVCVKYINPSSFSGENVFGGRNFNTCTPGEYVPELALLRVTRENLINAQKNSEEIKSLYEQAASQVQVTNQVYSLEKELLVKNREDKLGNVEVFTKLNIDACGPLPITSKGNRYLITAICMSSKFPEAIPVSDISSVSVTDALLNIFSRMGFPREIQCDQGTSFTSALTTEFFERFGILVRHSSVYHPQSNPVERFHRTLKRLLRVLCLDAGSE
ncbi:retrovirus-related Pol polyprotein from transposon 17.6 [Trichonephila clavipes]|nr:retrovirus-related Pol polyprotein from transposon 17.6 [Trichonephila clavipes]